VQQNITITPVAFPPGLPSGFTPVGAAVDISVDNPTEINVPFQITLPYDPTGVADESNMSVVHYNTTTMQYEPVTILAQDTTAHTFQIESRVFSPVGVFQFTDADVPISWTTPFTPSANGWNIGNLGSYLTQDGNCFGMAAYAAWYFHNGNSPTLNGGTVIAPPFSATGDVASIANILATRAQLAQSETWIDEYLNGNFYGLTAADVGKQMKLDLANYKNQPLGLLLYGKDTSGKHVGHVGVVYGYDLTGFQFYDPNFVGVSQTLSFNGTSFGTYFQAGGAEFNAVYYFAPPSVGRTEDFAALTAEAVGGFASSSLISVTSPKLNQQIPTTSTPLAGTLSSSINPAATMIAYVPSVQNAPINITPSNYTFSTSLPIASGKNTIILLAADSYYSPLQDTLWYTNSAALIFPVTGVAQTAAINNSKSIYTLETTSSGGCRAPATDNTQTPGVQTPWPDFILTRSLPLMSVNGSWQPASDSWTGSALGYTGGAYTLPAGAVAQYTSQLSSGGVITTTESYSGAPVVGVTSLTALYATETLNLNTGAYSQSQAYTNTYINGCPSTTTPTTYSTFSENYTDLLTATYAITLQ
jgi:hypothetical protein